MFTRIKHFLDDWKAESEATRKFLSVLNDEVLEQKISDQHRNMKHILWHIIQSIPEMGQQMGLNVKGPLRKEEMPQSVKEIQSQYDLAAQSLYDEISTKWNDETLEVEDDLYGYKWKRGFTLMTLIKHEIHHRAQAMVLARQAGIKIPGVYGPSKEEWSQYGSNPPEF